MSDSKIAKLWNWFCPVPATKAEKTLIETDSGNCVISKFQSNPIDIKHPLLGETVGYQRCLLGKNFPVTKSFLQLQRLDSTGNSELKSQSRFSYPPYESSYQTEVCKPFDQDIMGNACMHSQSQSQAVLNRRFVQRVANSHCDIAKTVSIQKLVGQIAGTATLAAVRFASMPARLNLNDNLSVGSPRKELVATTMLGNNSEMFIRQDSSDGSLSAVCPPRPLKPTSPDCPVGARCSEEMPSSTCKSDDKPREIEKSSDSAPAAGTSGSSPENDFNSHELPDMCKVCNSKDRSCSVIEQHHPNISLNTTTSTLNPAKLQNLSAWDELSDISSDESNDEGDCDTDCSSDCESEPELRVGLTVLEPTENTRLCAGADSDTDSEECPWDKIVSRRKPWTCTGSKRMKQTRASISSDYSSDESSQLDSDDEWEDIAEDEQLPTAEHSGDSCFEEGDFQSVSKDISPLCTETRPMCSNSQISFILGWGAEDQCDDGNDGDDDDVFSEQDTFSASSESEPRDGSSCSCVIRSSSWSSSESPAFRVSESEEKTGPPSCEAAKKLWDFFVQFHEPFVRLGCGQSTNKANPTPSNGESSNQRQRKDSCSHQNSTVNASADCEQISYKAPSKVRFCDKVIVHPMIAWSFAYKKARKGNWECFARDNSRFRCRVNEVEKNIAWCLAQKHRNAIWISRHCEAI